MSRVCVKNLPAYVNEDKLRDHFGSQGEITDVKIIRNAAGASRLFGFVGFRAEAQAESAIKYFNKTFLGTARLVVEPARKVGDGALPRPWSKYTEGSSANARQNETGIASTSGQPGALKHAKGNSRAAKAAADSAEPLTGGGAPAADEAEPAAGAKTAKGSKKKAGAAAAAAGADDANDPKLREFLEVMQPRRAARLWANDDGVEEAADAAARGGRGKAAMAAAKAAAAGGRRTRAQDEEDDADEDGEDEGSAGEEDDSGDDDDSEDVALDAPKAADVMDEEVSDAEYLKRRMTKSFDSDDDDDDDDDEEEEEREEEEAAESSEEEEEEGEENEERDAGEPEPEDGPKRPAGAGAGEAGGDDDDEAEDTGRVFVRNLSYGATEDDLRALFAEHGTVNEVHVVVDRDTRISKGYAYVQFLLPEDANRAMQALDGSIFQGRLLHLLPAKKPPAPPALAGAAEGGRADAAPGASAFKTAREEARKKDAGNARSWNSLFLRADTVAEVVAAKYGVSKSALLDMDANDVAVRMALGEAHVIAETKKELGDAGIHVAALEEAARAADRTGAAAAGVARSDTVLLVKNLPFVATEAELCALFGRFGALGRLVLPSTKALALVEFLEASQARAAFKGLAYTRFKHLPLYLEWAPATIIKGPAPAGMKARLAAGGSVAAAPPPAAKADGSEAATVDAVEAEEEVEAAALYVKNLAFATTDAGLHKHFSRAGAGAVRAAHVVTKAGKKKGELLSCGYGFVEMASPEAARAALRSLQGSTLDGHALQLSLSKGGPAAAANGNGADTAAAAPTEAGGATEASWSRDRTLSTTKLIVRNVAFEATKKDLRGLFGPFGQVKSLRLPRKFDGHHRGFGFVEFVTAQEAQSAYEAVRGAHLYGRHLVLERAKEDEGVDELRTRTAAQFEGGSAAARGEAGAPAKKARRAGVGADEPGAGKAFGRMFGAE